MFNLFCKGFFILGQYMKNEAARLKERLVSHMQDTKCTSSPIYMKYITTNLAIKPSEHIQSVCICGQKLNSPVLSCVKQCYARLIYITKSMKWKKALSRSDA